ncbi:hypothetical protein MMC14_009453 [Varicellaria rhodocarpa]|nr:hypothetical protein [Varicellaria rhodocarpa]
MDPLSLTASIIAIFGVGGQIANTLRKLASSRGSSDLLIAINNELSDLHLVVLAIQDVLRKQQPIQSSINASVTVSIRQAYGKVLELLQALHDRFATVASNTEEDEGHWSA